MSEIHEFRCDSCKAHVEAKYNGEHYLPPKGWARVTEEQSTNYVGHFCGDCVCVALNHPLKVKFAKWLKRFLK